MAQWLDDFMKKHPERFVGAEQSSDRFAASGAARAEREGAAIMTAMEGLPTLAPARELVAPATRMTTLPNGVRVISIDTFCGVCSVGAFVDAGSRHETAANSGVGNVLEKLAFKGGAGENGRSLHEVAALMEQHGISPTTMSSREHIHFQLEALREHMPTLVDLLSETCLTPALREGDLEEARTLLDFEEQDREFVPEEIVTELVHQAAYGASTGLGQAQLCSAQRAREITVPMLRDFTEQRFTGSSIVVAAAGVDHDEFVAEAERCFGGAVPGAAARAESGDKEGAYTGGHVYVDAAPSQMALSSFHVNAPPALCHVAVGFEAVGWTDDELVPMCVMSTLLGGGSSFSAGGPGKGMYSRLYLQVLNRHYWVESARAFPVMYDSTGLFYIYGTAEPANAHDLVSVLMDQVSRRKWAPLLGVTFTVAHACTDPSIVSLSLSLFSSFLFPLSSLAKFAMCAVNPPSEIETQRAKNQLKSAVLMNLESRQIMCEDLGRQVLTYGRRKAEAEVCERIDAVTPQELQQVSYAMMMRSPLSLAAYGDVSRLQPYEFYDGFFEERFRQHLRV